MKQEQEFFEINRNAWNAKTDIHIQSAFYNMDAFLKGNNSLNDIKQKNKNTNRYSPFSQCFFHDFSIS